MSRSSGIWWVRGGLFSLFFIIASDAAAGGVSPLEASLMKKLTTTQEYSGAKLKPFTTDGCSGGMTAGWEYMARTFPRYAHLMGKTPPWEYCCVSHDFAYWQGRGKGGVEQRVAADQALRRCVIDVGRQKAQDFARRFKLPVLAVRDAFRTSAELMYTAVRVGGLPCTHLPWRWGYGWPECERGVGGELGRLGERAER